MAEFLQNYIKSFRFYLWEFEFGYKTQIELLQGSYPNF